MRQPKQGAGYGRTVGWLSQWLACVGLCACATTGGQSEAQQVVASCEHVSWRTEEVPAIDEEGTVVRERLRTFDLESFEACVQTFGYEAKQVAPEWVAHGARERACRSEASMPLRNGLPADDGTAHLVPVAYQSCLNAPDVATGE